MPQALQCGLGLGWFESPGHELLDEAQVARKLPFDAIAAKGRCGIGVIRDEFILAQLAAAPGEAKGSRQRIITDIYRAATIVRPAASASCQVASPLRSDCQR
jgi:hypothetical protein